MTLTSIISCLAVALTIVQFAPQALRAWRISVEGVSLASWALFTITTASWLSYGISTHHSALTVVNLIVGPLAWLLLLRLARRSAADLRYALAAVVAALVASLLMWGWPTASVAVLAAVEVLAVLPQTLVVFRSRELEGVSSLTWLAVFVAQGLWGIYGALSDQLAVSLGGFAGAALALLTAARLLWLRRQHVHPAAD